MIIPHALYFVASCIFVFYLIWQFGHTVFACAPPIPQPINLKKIKKKKENNNKK